MTFCCAQQTLSIRGMKKSNKVLVGPRGGCTCRSPNYVIVFSRPLRFDTALGLDLAGLVLFHDSQYSTVSTMSSQTL